MRAAVYDDDFREDMRWWVTTDRKVALRLIDLIEATLRDPFGGIAKPERLRHLGPDTWSRRLTQDDRIVYRVYTDRVTFVAARGHY